MSRYILEVENIKVRYSGLPVLQGVSVNVKSGETVCVVGANGSGKSTLLRAVMGAQRVFEGKIEFQGAEIHKLRTEEIVRMGIVYVPEEKMLFKPLSVEENLYLGAYVLNSKEKIQENLDLIYGLFPPILVDEVLDTVRRLKEEGITILLVEQNVREALDLADRGYILQTGRITGEGTGHELLDSDIFRSAFLGI
ncbi:MAG: branched-chain amino acid ABC transporter ATP-binding protein [Desulfobacteraceae bacterium 4572_87]|nr:MAG: branched-chain amino acid ABC transporter ATP-binding protein [Desulfobacteraceae bacterium 4572_87]